MIAGNNIQKSHASGHGFFAFGAAAFGVWGQCHRALFSGLGREVKCESDSRRDRSRDWYILLIDTLGGAMGTKPGSKLQSTDAKLFWNGRSQAVRLPKEFRFEGDRVRVTRMGAGILIEPLPAHEEESMEELFARMDAMGADPIFPEGRKQNLAPIREYFK